MVDDAEIRISAASTDAGSPLVALRTFEGSIQIREFAKPSHVGATPTGVIDFGQFAVERTTDSLMVYEKQLPTDNLLFSQSVEPIGFSLVLGPDGTIAFSAQNTELTDKVGSTFPIIRHPFYVGEWEPEVLVTSPVDHIEQGTLRVILFVVGLGGLAGFAGSYLEWKPPKFRLFRLPRLPRWRLADVFVAVMSFLAAFFLPSHADEGWIMARAEAFTERGYLGNLYSVADAIHPTGSALESVWALLISAGATHIHLRLIFFVLNVATWWLLSRSGVLQRIMGFSSRTHRQASVGVAATVYVIGVLYFSASIRPEGLVAFLSVVFMAAATRFLQSRDHRFLAGALASSAVAASVHQSGLVLLFPSLLLVGASFVSVNPRGRLSMAPLARPFVALSSAAILFMITIFRLTPMPFLLSEFQQWRTSATHSASWWDEIDRLERLWETPGGRLIILGLIFNFLVFIVRFKRRDSAVTRFTHLMWTVFPAGLLFTASKWEWHYGAVLPGAVIGWALATSATLYFLRKFDKRFNGRSRRFAEGSLLWMTGAVGLFILARGLEPRWVNWAPEWADGAILQVVSSFLNLPQSALFLMLWMAPVVVWGYALARRHTARYVAATFIVVFAGYSSGLMALHANPVSFASSELRQRVGDIAGLALEGCGTLSGIDLVVGVTKIEGQELKKNGIAGVLNDSMARTESFSKRIPVGHLAKGSLLGYWWFPGQEDKSTALLEFFDQGGHSLAKTYPNRRFDGWHLIAMTLPAEVEYAVVRVSEVTSVHVSDLAVLTEAPAETVLAKNVLLAGPHHYQSKTCAIPYVFDGNFVTDFNYATSKTLYGRGPLPNLVEVTASSETRERLFLWEDEVRLR